MTEQCSNCRCFLDHDGITGFCRRYPEALRKYSDGWCGEYQAKKSEGKPVKKSKSGETWKAYADAYFNRYNTEPVRNAKVNSQLSQVVDRIGAEEAPHVAAYYVDHNSAFYIQRGHSVAQLLVDCEKLRTEWATNQQITTAQARQIDRTQTNQNVFLQLLDEENDG